MSRSAAVERASAPETSAERLLEAAAGDAGFAAFELVEIVKTRPGRIVARGRMAEGDVYVKFYHSEGGPEIVRSACAEMDRMGSVMGEGRLRIARLVASSPSRGLIAIEAVGGRRLDKALKNATPAEQMKLHRLAGAWLGRYVAPSRDTRPFDPARFLAKVRGLVFTLSEGPRPSVGDARTRRRVNVQLQREDRERREALRAWMIEAAVKAAATPVSIAGTHDDFTPTNLTVTQGEGLVGYDLTRFFVSPVADSAARLLTVQVASRQAAGTCMGVSAAHVEGVVESGVLGRDEAAVVLPLYVAQNFDVMLGRHASRSALLPRLREAIDAFLRSPRVPSCWLAHLAVLIVPVI